MEKLSFEKKPVLTLSKDFVFQMTHLHREVGRIEWSGLLYYTVLEGTIKEPGTLKMRAEHIFPLDVGNSTYTEYEVDDDVIDFYDAHEDAMTMKVGHIHTHHNMGTTPSGTDTSEIEENVVHHNYYLSLIVNFDGKYTALIGIEIESEGQQYMKDESGERYSWEMKKHKKTYLIDVDVILEPEEWFSEQYNTISAPETSVIGQPEMQFARWLINKKKGHITFIQSLEKYSKMQSWTKKTSQKIIHKNLDAKLREWSSRTGQDYQTLWDLKKFYEEIEDYKNALSVIMSEVLAILIDEKDKTTTVKTFYNKHTNGKSKNSPVSKRRMGQLGFRY
jgi:proteasome lid subunit RPN8/RPN11